MRDDYPSWYYEELKLVGEVGIFGDSELGLFLGIEEFDDDPDLYYFFIDSKGGLHYYTCVGAFICLVGTERYKYLKEHFLSVKKRKFEEVGKNWESTL